MPYLIDGHNLIPKVPGLSLSETDDELRLIEMLQEFCRLRRKEAEVFFDNAPPGGVRARQFGQVVARFVRQGITADDAIQSRLKRLGRASRNWIVVSSDRTVQTAARAAQARFLSSEEFARLLQQTLDDTQLDQGKNQEITLKPDELEGWLRLFDVSDDQ